ncbi:hypothetical protein TRAPUB_4074 [Trametes pubescens]|uniref:F-box domain-containing protein n=1 Tax=Trametes pubescens TaxID=154538 RepID=A0A1M2VC36_TRAPU|nr:hypothetical protein TRAPUB_4074 [Trametes pubescens]
MQPALPIEIVEWILDFVLEEAFNVWRAVLKQCILVCRAWVPHCRFHLFKRRWLRCPDVLMRVYRMRERVKTWPHLCNYVQQFELAEKSQLGRPLRDCPFYPIFLTALAPHFPSLCKMFCAPAFKAPAITSLLVSNLIQGEWTDICDVIALFPNLHGLTFDGVRWPMTREDGSRAKALPLRPRRILSLPPIIQLAVATTTRTTIDTQTELSENSYAQLDGLMTLVSTFTGTLTYFKINLGTFNHFTDPILRE